MEGDIILAVNKMKVKRLKQSRKLITPTIINSFATRTELFVFYN